MNTTDVRCKRCGSIMAQKGAENQYVTYHCNSCGYNEYVEMKTADNSEYWIKRSALLGRVRQGIVDWQVTGWDYLQNDIFNFMSSYEAARYDIYFKIATVACLTKGFHDMNNEKYRDCKRLFKVTESVYKRYRKDPMANDGYKKETGETGMVEYEEYRGLYKKCLYEFRCTQFAWKILFTLGKKIIPFGKLFG